MSCYLASNRVRSETFGKKYQQSAMETFGRVYRVGLEDKKLVFARLSSRTEYYVARNTSVLRIISSNLFCRPLSKIEKLKASVCHR